MYLNKLENVNYNSIQGLINFELLPPMNFEKNYDYDICLKSKFTNISFQTIERNNKPMVFMHYNW